MAWWLAVPIATWGVKKIYDAVTEDDGPSYSSNSGSSSTISSAKSNRTRVRKKFVRDLILKNREKLVTANLCEVDVKNVALDGSAKTSLLLNTERDKLEIQKLNNSIKVLNPSFCLAIKEECDLNLFSDIDKKTSEIVTKANEQYGEMAGINSSNRYDESTDSFLNHLKSKY